MAKKQKRNSEPSNLDLEELADRLRQQNSSIKKLLRHLEEGLPEKKNRHDKKTTKFDSKE